MPKIYVRLRTTNGNFRYDADKISLGIYEEKEVLIIRSLDDTTTIVPLDLIDSVDFGLLRGLPEPEDDEA